MSIVDIISFCISTSNVTTSSYADISANCRNFLNNSNKTSSTTAWEEALLTFQLEFQ